MCSKFLPCQRTPLNDILNNYNSISTYLFIGYLISAPANLWKTYILGFKWAGSSLYLLWPKACPPKIQRFLILSIEVEKLNHIIFSTDLFLTEWKMNPDSKDEGNSVIFFLNHRYYPFFVIGLYLPILDSKTIFFNNLRYILSW